MAEGNFIGTDSTGKVARGNSSGVDILGASDNTVGGTTLAARNIISGNTSGPGVAIRAGVSEAKRNKVQGNLIGVDASGTPTETSGNHRGVFVLEGAHDNVIGGTTAGSGNVIAGNRFEGLHVNPVASGAVPTNNRILSNSIFSNGGIGINLKGGIEDAQGRTENDPKDPDPGPNLLQNHPVVTTAKPIKKRVRGRRRPFTLIAGTLNSTPGETFTIQLFRNPSGEDEGKTLLTQFTRTTDANGDASFGLRVRRASAPIGSNITATATDSFGNTSEFSLPKTVGRRGA